MKKIYRGNIIYYYIMDSEKELDTIIDTINTTLIKKKKEEEELKYGFDNFIVRGLEDLKKNNIELGIINLLIGLNNKKTINKHDDKYSVLINTLLNNKNQIGGNIINQKTESSNLTNNIENNSNNNNNEDTDILPSSLLETIDYEQFFNKKLLFNFNSIPGYTYVKKQFFEKFIYPYIFTELYLTNKHNLLVFGPTGNNDKMLTRMCVGELKNLSPDIYIAYLELDLRQMLIYKSEDINRIFNKMIEIINNNKKKYKISKGVILFDQINYLFNNGDSNKLLSELFKNLEQTDNNKEFMILASSNSLSTLPKEILEKFPNKLFIDNPNYFERVYYILEFILKRYTQNFPNKLLNIVFALDLDYGSSFYINFIKFKDIFLNKQGVNLLDQYPLIKDIIISINESGSKILKTETLDEYKNRLKNQIEFIKHIFTEDKIYNSNAKNYIEEFKMEYESVLNNIDDLTINEESGILSFFKQDGEKIIINYYKYFVLFTNKYIDFIINKSGVNIDQQTFNTIKNSLSSQLGDFFIFIHYIAEILGPNIEIYKIGILNDRKFSENTISSYGYSYSELGKYIEQMTSIMAANIIESKYTHNSTLSKCKLKFSEFEKPYSECYQQSNSIPSPPKAGIHPDDLLNITYGIVKDKMFTYTDDTDSVFDILAFFKASYFYKSIKEMPQNYGNSDNYCMSVCEKNYHLYYQKECKDDCKKINEYLLSSNT